MEEKKLTDEQILMSLEVCNDKSKDCCDCPLNDEFCEEKGQILIDFIKRLQGKIQTLEEYVHELKYEKESLMYENSYYNHIVEQEKLLTRATTVYRFVKRFMHLLNVEVLDYRNDLFTDIQNIVNKVSREIIEGANQNEKSTNQNQSTID